MDTEGNFNYVRNAGTPDGVQDVFNYTLADAAGANASTTLTIDIGQSLRPSPARAWLVCRPAWRCPTSTSWAATLSSICPTGRKW